MVFSNVRACVDVSSESETGLAVDDDQQSTVKLLADARRMAYVKGRWVYTDTGSEQLYQIVCPTLPGNGDYSLASTITCIYRLSSGDKFPSCWSLTLALYL